MRRTNVDVDVELHERVEGGAHRRLRSKTALIRQGLLADRGSSTPGDPVDQLVAASDAEPVHDIDAVTYGA